MSVFEELKKSEKIFLSIVSLELTTDSEWVKLINVEHSWYSPIVNALNLYDLVESEITKEEVVLNLLKEHLSDDDYKIIEGTIWLRYNLKILEAYLSFMDSHIMDYLEYQDNR